MQEFTIWSRIHFLNRNHANGSLCLNTQLAGLSKASSASDLKQQCREWVEAGKPAGDKTQWLVNFQESLGPKFDFYAGGDMCEVLETAIDQHCGFDAEVVQRFTAASLGNGGDFTLSFWYKPSGHVSVCVACVCTFVSIVVAPCINTALNTQLYTSNIKLHSQVPY
jgi:hypothetical protein